MKRSYVALLALGISGVANAQTLVLWTFDTFTANSNTSFVGTVGVAPTSTAPSIAGVLFTTNFEGGVNTNASGTPTGTVGSFGGTTVNDPRPVPSATGSLVGTGGLTSPNVTNNGANFTWQITSVAGQVLNLSSFSFATRGTSTGFSNNQLSWSTDGVNFTNVGATWGATSSTFPTISTDLSGVSGLQGASNVYMRITFNGATSTAGNNRIDNIILAGTASAVPEPATMGIMGIGLAAIAARRRRKKA